MRKEWVHVKEWVHEKLGIPQEEQRVVAVQGGRVLHNGFPLNLGKKFLKLKVDRGHSDT